SSIRARTLPQRNRGARTEMAGLRLVAALLVLGACAESGGNSKPAGGAGDTSSGGTTGAMAGVDSGFAGGSGSDGAPGRGEGGSAGSGRWGAGGAADSAGPGGEGPAGSSGGGAGGSAAVGPCVPGTAPAGSVSIELCAVEQMMDGFGAADIWASPLTAA